MGYMVHIDLICTVWFIAHKMGVKLMNLDEARRLLKSAIKDKQACIGTLLPILLKKEQK